LGIVIAPLSCVAEPLATGKLRRVLPNWTSPLEAVYLYFPGRRHQSAALRAFMAFAKNASQLPAHGMRRVAAVGE